MTYQRQLPRFTLVVFTVLACMATTLLAQDAQAASSYRKCALTEREQDPPGSKPTYNLKLERIGGSCATARRVMASYHRCRSKTGTRCSSKLLGDWSCTAKVDSKIATQFNATATCRYGTRRVRIAFQQST